MNSTATKGPAMYPPRTENTIFQIDVSVDHLTELARQMRQGADLNITPENREELAKKLWNAVYDIIWEFIDDNVDE
jgi:hypothetical protein